MRDIDRAVPSSPISSIYDIILAFVLASALSLYLRNLETELTQIMSIDKQLLELLHE